MQPANADQTVRIANHAPVPFEGWKRTTIDFEPLHLAGQVGDARYVIGRRVGLDTDVVDVWCRLEPGQVLELDLGRALPIDFELEPLGDPGQLLEHFGGALQLGDRRFEFVSVQPDGAAYSSHLKVRTGRMFCTHVWLRWYPDAPGIAYGEALHIASNPAVPDMGEVSTGDKLKFGDALVIVPGRGVNPSLVEAGQHFADGAAIYIPFVLAWLRHFQARDWATTGAAANFGVGAVGIRDLWGEGHGAPRFPDSFSGRIWANGKLRRAVDALGRLDQLAPCGPNARSADTGMQEDQLMHPGGEAMLPDGVGAEWVRLLSAMKVHAARPCNHLEADGSGLDPDAHPGLLFQDGRPSLDTRLNTDLLGKTRGPTEAEAHGYYGPDNQHWLMRSLGASARLTGSPAAQFLLERLAVALLLQRTTTPGWATSAIFSAREVGYFGLAAVQFWRDLENRPLAERIRQHWRDWVQRIALPERDGWDVFFVFDNDARLAPGKIAIAWQEGLGAYGYDYACEVLGPQDSRELGLRVALRVVNEAYVESPNGWLVRDIRVDEGAKPPAAPGWDWHGCAMAVATVLRHDPEHAKARAIWEHLLDSGAYRWLPTGAGL